VEPVTGGAGPVVGLERRDFSRVFIDWIAIMDDSHGVGAFGSSGRGTEEVTGTTADLLIGTLGKAFGVNGGYVVGSAVLVRYLRETSPL